MMECWTAPTKPYIALIVAVRVMLNNYVAYLLFLNVCVVAYRTGLSKVNARIQILCYLQIAWDLEVLC